MTATTSNLPALMPRMSLRIRGSRRTTAPSRTIFVMSDASVRSDPRIRRLIRGLGCGLHLLQSRSAKCAKRVGCGSSACLREEPSARFPLAWFRPEPRNFRTACQDGKPANASDAVVRGCMEAADVQRCASGHRRSYRQFSRPCRADRQAWRRLRTARVLDAHDRRFADPHVFVAVRHPVWSPLRRRAAAELPADAAVRRPVRSAPAAADAATVRRQSVPRDGADRQRLAERSAADVAARSGDAGRRPAATEASRLHPGRLAAADRAATAPTAFADRARPGGADRNGDFIAVADGAWSGGANIDGEGRTSLIAARRADHFAANRCVAAFRKAPCACPPLPGKPACCTHQTVTRPCSTSIVMSVAIAPPWPNVPLFTEKPSP
jgi:hypothetical protein